MADPTYVLGQRWISNTEPELGLGIITAFENRRITISFPAAGASRTYAVNNAPINRVRYQVGDEVRDNDDLNIIVTEVREEHDYLIYVGTDKHGNTCTVPELEIDSFVHFRRPQDRLFSGQVDKPSDYQLRVHSLLHQQRLRNHASRGLIGARVQLLAHQLHIADEVARRFAPRVLLADEVGLGKTIEAGLIIHQQLFTDRAQRILIVVPEALIHQWLVEMLRRFNLSFTILDEERCQALTDDEDEFGEISLDGESIQREAISNQTLDKLASLNNNPFDTTQLALCPINLFIENELRLNQAAGSEWDLLVVDEAHHLQWSEEVGSDSATPEQQIAVRAYQCIETLSQHSQGLLLLTATPEQLGVKSHFARLRLLDPDRYFDFEKFLAEEDDYKQANDILQSLLTTDRKDIVGDKSLREQLKNFLGQEKTDQLVHKLKDDNADHDAILQEAVNFLLDHHGTGRVLFRNTRNAVKGFPQRQLIKHPLAAPEVFIERAGNASIEQQLQAEQLLGSGDTWLQTDPRVNWLTDWLKSRRRDKVLLICHSQETVLNLEEYLRLRVGLRSAAFHEGLSLIERDRAAAYFADDIDGAQVLLCSEIGSEGRNFQFAHHLVLFDLPLNPDLLEQRIGRLARIGQRADVQIHAPYFEDSCQEKLLQWFHEGLNAVEESCPAAQALFQQFEHELIQHLSRDTKTQWQEFLQLSQLKAQEAQQKLAEGRDRLLELSSCNMDHADLLITSIDATDRDPALREYMNRIFDAYNIEEDHHSEHSIVLHPSDHVHDHYLPGLTDEGLTATFNRETALSREDMEFLTWEHPMVTGSMDMILSNEKGNATVCSAKLPPLKGGTLLLETVFSLQCPGPKALQLGGYFDLTTLRYFISKDHDLSKVVQFQQLNQLQQTVPKKTALEIIKFARNDINDLLNKSQKLAEERRETLVKQAVDKMLKQQHYELERLQTLAKVNPNVRQIEITFLKEHIKALEHHLHLAQVGLDCLRVVVCA